MSTNNREVPTESRANMEDGIKTAGKHSTPQSQPLSHATVHTVPVACEKQRGVITQTTFGADLDLALSQENTKT